MTEPDFSKIALELVNDLAYATRQEHPAIIRRYLERMYKAGNESKSKAFPASQPNTNPELVSTNWEPVIDQCERILDMIGKLPERAEDFGESVTEKVEGIQETIMEKEYVTPNQQLALDNMEEAVKKWIR